MAWFKRTDKGIKTSTAEKKDAPDGLWFKTPNGTIVHTRELKSNAYVCPNDDFHVKIGSKEYFEILFDNNVFTELDEGMKSGDPLKFVDTKSYYQIRIERCGKDSLWQIEWAGVSHCLHGL
jgi:acetyl-CoA carboxylase carboxyl transferase subunit beta